VTVREVDVTPEPHLFQYLDYRAFLRDWLASRAGRPSLRGFARRAHCSPSLVSSIIGGKRALDTGRAEVFAATMKLDAAQTSHLVALVVFAHDPSGDRRQRALDEVLTTRRFRDKAEQQFGALALAVPSQAVAELEARVSRFYEEILHLVEETAGPRDRLYQLCVELYPVASGSVRPSHPDGVRDHRCSLETIESMPPTQPSGLTGSPIRMSGAPSPY
jgi:hypothetical protein